MPELPEVEAARQLLHDHCRNKVISKAICADDDSALLLFLLCLLNTITPALQLSLKNFSPDKISSLLQR